MIMNVKKQLQSLFQLALPGVGFMLTCWGAYLVSTQSEYRFRWRLIPAYFMIGIGFLAVIVGISWNIYDSMRSKLYQRGRREQHVEVYTVERLSSYPPSYEESQSSRLCPDPASEFVVVVDGVDVLVSLAPPLYSQDSSEAPDCTWSWEQPPRYSQVERIQLGEVDGGERRESFARH